MKHLILPLFALLLVACGAPKETPKTAQEHFAEGEMFFENRLYDDAISSWEKVREAYYSPELTALAEFKIAEAYYLSKRYVEAAAAYEDFLRQHPRHERTPEILYMLGMSYHRQVLSVDRDQSATRNALLTFENLTRRFPDHPRSAEVRPLMGDLRERLAGHELYVGRFYQRTGHPHAAIRRLEDLFRNYSQIPDKDEAYFYLGQAYLSVGREDEARETFEKMFTEFPQSKHARSAQRSLEKLN